MKALKKALRFLCVVMFCILGSVGVGLSGGAVIPVFRRREDKPAKQIELVEEDSGVKH
ncbi:hypothetical protein [Mucilaginibacter sp. FT3.2]|uniref:hypothetical protein n=1 Tax=Mucilaginibacter sp. FT3.2 TaxID=2723090 RepID=UPI0016194676|nr:hypothetical protein [Mucilaginibacter sp. FT3.2]MBB6232797.1 hypothetical protein [Mucilaginibacter sp. FT3.2]